MEETYFQRKNILLRPFEPEDFSDLQAYLNHPSLAGRRYLPWGIPDDLPLSASQVEKILQKWNEDRDALHLAVVALGDDIGLAGHLEFENGWDPHGANFTLVISPLYQCRGYGSEALEMLLGYAFGSTPAHNVSCWVADWNETGRLFLSRRGFTETGRSRRVGLRQGKVYDLVIYDLLRPEWMKTRE